MEKSENQGIFINGKQQIIEMLQFMNQNERQQLLQNIRTKNAAVARELTEKSFSFKDLAKLNEVSIKRVFSQCNPAIVGLALYAAPVNLQRKVLSSLDRGFAERAFEIMNKNLATKALECERAQNKILQIAIKLSRSQQISI